MENFRKELLRTDVIPRKLNDVSKKYRKLFLKDLESRKIKTEEVNKCQCGSSNLEQLTKIDRFGLPFGSLICKDCGLVITSPRIVEESLPYYYDTYYHPLNYGKEHLENQSVLYEDGQGTKIFNILKKFLPKQDELNVLEIGAGTGNVLDEFKQEAKKYNVHVNELGTEYSNDCIRICEEKGVKTIYGNIKTIAEMEKKFDVIILSHVFEHFIDLQTEIVNLKKIMHKDSLLYIEVPGILESHKKEYYDFSFLGYLIHAHMYNFTKDTLVNILQKNGFKNIYMNEKVESIFKLDSMVETIEKYNSYDLIIDYLEKFYEAYDFLKYAILKKLEKQNIRIQTRDEDIQNLKDTIEKQNIRIQTRDEEIESLKDKIQKQAIRIETRDKEIESLKHRNKEQEKKIVVVKKFLGLSFTEKLKNYKKLKGVFL